MNLITFDRVDKTFSKIFQQKTTILENISFNIQKGEFVILRGENGSGKSTILNLALGLLKPSSGEVKLMGRSPQDSNSKLKVGVVLQDTQIPPNAKVIELVKLWRSYYPDALSTDEILSKVNLKGKEQLDASGLSGGQKQRLYFALALAGNPELLILDEPTRNLDDKGYKEFWQQIKLCYQAGITVLMVTNNKSDWQELESLATREITLHKHSEAPASGQLTEKTLQSNSRNFQTNFQTEETSSNLLFAFIGQLRFEIQQLLRTPLFLIMTIALVAFVPLLKQLGIYGDTAIESLSNFCGVILFTIVIERLGKRVVVERAEKWLKMLKVTCLPSYIHIAAKVATSLLICTVSVFLTFILGHWQLGIDAHIGMWIHLFLVLTIGIVPFAILGLTLGYLINPKSADSIIGLTIIVIPVACGAFALPIPNYLQDAITLSPFYHYKEAILWAAGLDYDNQIFLHLTWLIWATIVFGAIALWSYQREQAIQ
ncbi:ABC transporter ATP-binding protein/permease [Myxosarcina sp. GI1]|uniref:ABC transporter ATP-binding protein/permease n=1 Tax=Myxosarcina sp. GI1 TaxID=1541065 RepID=UPI00055F4C06|nr:ABC transporter ATP-binding protein/permease [Myxosarcina sp. GI1]